MFRPIAIAFAACLFAAPAFAQSCSFTLTGLNFGNVDTLAGGAVDITGSVQLTCSGSLLGLNVRVCLSINAGTGGSTGATRHMRNPASDPLSYGLFQDAARTTPWGSVENPALGGHVQVDLTSLLLTPVTQTRTIYGRVLPGQQGAPAGPYSSSVDLRITYDDYLLLFPPSCSGMTQNMSRPSIPVQANVPPNCLVTAQNVDFGTRGVLDTDVDATGGVGVTCTPGTAYNIGLDNGLTGTGPTARRMTLGAGAVVYGLYKDPGRSQPWGSAGAELLPGTGSGGTQNATVYGRVPPQATPVPGVYSDTVVVTVTY